jgi:hypothetical protein
LLVATRLSDVKLSEEEVLVDGFEAEIQGVTVQVTAVLERTCVYVTKDGERHLAAKSELMVNPAELPIRRRKLG